MERFQIYIPTLLFSMSSNFCECALARKRKSGPVRLATAIERPTGPTPLRYVPIIPIYRSQSHFLHTSDEPTHLEAIRNLVEVLELGLDVGLVVPLLHDRRVLALLDLLLLQLFRHLEMCCTRKSSEEVVLDLQWSVIASCWE